MLLIFNWINDLTLNKKSYNKNKITLDEQKIFSNQKLMMIVHHFRCVDVKVYLQA